MSGDLTGPFRWGPTKILMRPLDPRRGNDYVEIGEVIEPDPVEMAEEILKQASDAIICEICEKASATLMRRGGLSWSPICGDCAEWFHPRRIAPLDPAQLDTSDDGS